MRSDYLSVMRRGFAVWLVIVFAESLHGIARVALLQPVLGDFRARQASMFSGILIIFTISVVFIRWIRAADNFQRHSVGLLWMILTIIFEISIGRLMNLSWPRILSDYDLARGGLMGFGLLFLYFAPTLAAKFREKLARRPRIAGH